jgi:hypothetical protein
MTTAVAQRPATTRFLTAPLLAGLGFATLAVTQLTLPAQARPFTRTSDYVIEWAYAAALLAGLVAVLALHAAHRGRAGWGRTGAVGTALYAAGHALVGTAVTVTAVRGDESLGLLFMPGLLSWLAGGVVLAVAAFRARLLPRPLAVALALSLPLTMALGHVGPLVEGGVWLAIAATLATGVRR